MFGQMFVDNENVPRKLDNNMYVHMYQCVVKIAFYVCHKYILFVLRVMYSLDQIKC